MDEEMGYTGIDANKQKWIDLMKVASAPKGSEEADAAAKAFSDTMDKIMGGDWPKKKSQKAPDGAPIGPQGHVELRMSVPVGHPFYKAVQHEAGTDLPDKQMVLALLNGAGQCMRLTNFEQTPDDYMKNRVTLIWTANAEPFDATPQNIQTIAEAHHNPATFQDFAECFSKLLGKDANWDAKKVAGLKGGYSHGGVIPSPNPSYGTKHYPGKQPTYMGNPIVKKVRDLCFQKDLTVVGGKFGGIKLAPVFDPCPHGQSQYNHGAFCTKCEAARETATTAEWEKILWELTTPKPPKPPKYNISDYQKQFIEDLESEKTSVKMGQHKCCVHCAPNSHYAHTAGCPAQKPEPPLASMQTDQHGNDFAGWTPDGYPIFMCKHGATAPKTPKQPLPPQAFCPYCTKENPLKATGPATTKGQKADLLVMDESHVMVTPSNPALPSVEEAVSAAVQAAPFDPFGPILQDEPNCSHGVPMSLKCKKCQTEQLKQALMAKQNEVYQPHGFVDKALAEMKDKSGYAGGDLIPGIDASKIVASPLIDPFAELDKPKKPKKPKPPYPPDKAKLAAKKKMLLEEEDDDLW